MGRPVYRNAAQSTLGDPKSARAASAAALRPGTKVATPPNWSRITPYINLRLKSWSRGTDSSVMNRQAVGLHVQTRAIGRIASKD